VQYLKLLGRVRHKRTGFLANRRRAALLPLCFQLLGAAQEPQAEQGVSSTNDSRDPWRIPKCGGPMVVVERLTPPKPNFVLDHRSPLPHETTCSSSNSPHTSACSVPLCLASEQNLFVQSPQRCLRDILSH
jgi:hypothetical protein